MTRSICWLWLAAACPLAAGEYERRVEAVTKTPGFIALWDFVKRDGGRFDAYKARGEAADLRLDAVNYVLDYWGQGRTATYGDFPLLGEGPFGQAVRIRDERDASFRPVLLVPRERLHDSGIDVKGPGRSVSLVVWLRREGGNHAIAGIWHEGTDLQGAAGLARRVEMGRRQYALFAGLAANNGAVAAHVSENGGKSFGDKYARNLSVTRRQLTGGWDVAAFSFDNKRNTVTSYLNGEAEEYWIDAPERHPFFQWPARGWLQAQLAAVPGLQPEEDPGFPRDQFYAPPEGKPLERTLISEDASRRVELHRFAYTKVRVTLGRDRRGRWREVEKRELASLRVNPFWFGHDLFSPPGAAGGGPFTIGRVIHSGRSVGMTGYLGGVAVFGRPLDAARMRRLASVASGGPIRANR